ncbi:lysoplasmalogenase [Sporosarcina gallistercoris]|uniref:Lysoplasmalogenase n=1 Tax=Sporosarcina gallistercoris TaxID=2762245 RepID=A0ABR8PIQ9_9BACL|nr:lysoplasmalogenase [Sporosarcina gallistercoris]MBD7908038.1 lysoplasmalogenase [Sporosarcina gallistercoris]
MRKVLLTLIGVMGFIYIFLIPEDPVGMKIAMKLVPMILIILYGALNKSLISPLYKRTVLIGLSVCMIADAAIYWFMAGLATFLVGHLFYIAAFRKASRKPVPLIAAVPLLFYGLFMAVWIAVPQLVSGELFLSVAIIAYMAVILLMGWEAIRTRLPLVITGALLFICSDSLLAIDRFVTPLPARDALVMITYYAAQTFIAASIGSRVPDV